MHKKEISLSNLYITLVEILLNTSQYEISYCAVFNNIFIVLCLVWLSAVFEVCKYGGNSTKFFVVFPDAENEYRSHGGGPAAPLPAAD